MCVIVIAIATLEIVIAIVIVIMIGNIQNNATNEESYKKN